MSIPTVDVVYTAVATAENGRDGRVASDDGKLDVVVNPPKEQGGSGAGTNPEQLFAAGYSACFQGALWALQPPAERVEVPYDGIRLPGLLRRPEGTDRPPVVLMIPGLDWICAGVSFPTNRPPIISCRLVKRDRTHNDFLPSG